MRQTGSVQHATVPMDLARFFHGQLPIGSLSVKMKMERYVDEIRTPYQSREEHRLVVLSAIPMRSG